MQKQDTQDIVDAVTALLNGDKSKDVRMAVVLSLPLDTHTLPVLLQRTRDTAPTVGLKLCQGLADRTYCFEAASTSQCVCAVGLPVGLQAQQKAGSSTVPDWHSRALSTAGLSLGYVRLPNGLWSLPCEV
jgi:hypothetical protein